MPLFNRELNELADRIGRTNLTIWLHTAAPTEGTPTNARISAGGGTYEIGATLLSSNISSASNGDIENSVAVDYRRSDRGRWNGHPLERHTWD